MTLQDILTKYYEELERGFHLYWMEALRNYGPETAHGLRVNLKRQNAFFHLLQALYTHFSAGVAMDTFAAIYRRAGKVRNKQVERELIEKNERKLHLEHRLSVWLGEKESRRAQLLQDYESGHSMTPVRELTAEVYAVIRSLPTEGWQSRLQGYFIKLIHGIIGFMRRGDIPTEDLHDLRKFIKELFYNLELLERLVGREKLQSPALSRLDELQHLLGKWHDYDFTLLHLERKRAATDPAFQAHLERERAAFESNARARFLGLEEAMLELEEKIMAALTATTQ